VTGLARHMTYRTRFEIITQILQTAVHANSNGGGASKTEIMYDVFLSHTQVQQYLSILIGNELLRYDKINQKFTITEKGHEFLKLFDEMDSFVRNKKESLLQLNPNK
jgi:predicted transcriptional regulator